MAKKTLIFDNRLDQAIRREMIESGMTYTYIVNTACTKYLEGLIFQNIIKKELQQNPEKMTEIMNMATKFLPKIE